MCLAHTPVRFIAVTVAFLFAALLTPAGTGAWPGTPVTSAPAACAATPFRHTLPPPWATSPNGGKARDWISGDGIMVGLRMDYLAEWIEGTNVVFLWSKDGGRIDATARRTGVTSAGGTVTLEQFAMMPNEVASAMWKFPTPGCWDVTLTIGAHTLRFSADAVPADQHAARKAAVARRAANLPGPIPADCPVSTWDGPRRVGPTPDYEFFIDGNGISLRSPDTIYAAGENDLQWLTGSGQELTLTGTRLGTPGTIADIVPYLMVPGSGSPDYWMTSLTFPHAGCWQLTATSGNKRLTATIYVFPARKSA